MTDDDFDVDTAVAEIPLRPPAEPAAVVHDPAPPRERRERARTLPFGSRESRVNVRVEGS